MVEKKLAAGYTPAQIGAFVMLLSQAEQQPQRGRFRSLVELRAAMDCMVEEAGPAASMSKQVPFLLKEGDVVKLERGDPHYVDGYPYYVEGWDEWQEGNWQVAERMRRVRERKNGTGSDPHPVTRTDTRRVTPADTASVTPDVTVDVTVGVTPDVTDQAENGAPAVVDALLARLDASDDAVEMPRAASYEPVPGGVLSQIAEPDEPNDVRGISNKPPLEFKTAQNVTVRDARRSAAAAVTNVPAAAGRVAVSRQRQAASEPAPLPMPLSPETAQRIHLLTEGCLEVLAGRPLKRFERDYVQGWGATLRRAGELVPVDEILGVVQVGMAKPTADGSPPANLGWVADDVAALARERAGPSLASLPRSVQEAVANDRMWAERAAQLRQEGR